MSLLFYLASVNEKTAALPRKFAEELQLDKILVSRMTLVVNAIAQEKIDQLLDSANTEEAVLHGKVLVVDCQLPSRGGFTVTGRAAVVDPANFRLEVGREICRESASNQLWQLEGYLLQLELAGLITLNLDKE